MSVLRRLLCRILGHDWQVAIGKAEWQWRPEGQPWETRTTEWLHAACRRCGVLRDGEPVLISGRGRCDLDSVAFYREARPR